MTVKKPVPCSLYDIRGIQEWLDEMALQGLFLKGVTYQFDRAFFEVGEPRPVRYRLDPVTRKGKKDDEYIALYAQMGWTYVDRIKRWYYIFSCDDPEAPELYSDYQSLSLAVDRIVRRNIRMNLLLALFLFAVLFLEFFVTGHSTFRNLLLWENPRSVFISGIYPVMMVICLPLLAYETHNIIKIRNTLAQGLPLKAEKRRNRPPWYAIWLPTYLTVSLLPQLLFPSVGWDVCGLEERALSHSWPTAAQVEAVGSSPLGSEPVIDGYIRYNDSPFAPVQEEVNRYRMLDPDDLTDTDLSTTIRYVRASSPRTARWLYRLEVEEETKWLNARQKSPYSCRVTELTPFAPRDWPGLDRLEVARYKDDGEDSWAFAALRGNDFLLVDYTGSARWEDCLPLFLEALDKEVAS